MGITLSERVSRAHPPGGMERATMSSRTLFTRIRCYTQRALAAWLLTNLAISSLHSQESNIATVRGKVVDALSGLPVAGARIVVARFDRSRNMSLQHALQAQPTENQDPKAERFAVLTGSDGSFHFRLQVPASFHLFVDAAGYAMPFKGIGPANTYVLKSGSSVPDILVRLVPSAGISGQVTDRDSGAPVRGRVVLAQRYRSAGPTRALVVEAQSTTDEQGRFALTRLDPGDYYLEVREPQSAIVEAPKSGSEFPEDVLMGYRAWYPDSPRVEEAIPVTVLEGSGVQDLKLSIKKIRLPRVRGRVVGDESTAESAEAQLALVHLDMNRFGGGQRILARGAVKIGSEFQIDNIPPGTYWLTASTSGPQRQAAALPVHISDRNQDGLDLFLSKGLVVKGSVRKVEEQGGNRPLPPGENLRVILRPLRQLLPDVPGFIAPVRPSDGHFTISGVYPQKYEVFLSGLAGYQVAEIRYNGSKVDHSVVEVGTATAHTVDIVVAPASSSIALIVKDGIRPAAGASVILAREPVDEEVLLLTVTGIREAKTDAEGHLTFSNLLPGVYRVIAYAGGVLWAEDPRFHERLASSKQIMVGPMQTTTAELQVQSQIR
jgi:hypothetical protein